MLTEKFVEHFLGQKLGILNWRSILERSNLEFLKILVLAHQKNCYYQNVSWSAVPKRDRKWPTLEEIIYYASPQSSTVGGTCIHLSYFVKLLLNHVGFDTFVVGVEAERWQPALRSHMATIVRLPVENDKATYLDDKGRVEHDLYFLDLGLFGPFLEPICLNRLPYVGRAGGFNFEYAFNPEKKVYERWDLLGSPVRGPHAGDLSKKLNYYFDLKPLELGDFEDCFDVIFSPNPRSIFLELLILSRLTKADSPLDFEYVSCQALVMIEGTKDTFKETTYESYETMLPDVQKKFPNLNHHELKMALAYYVQLEKEKKKSDAADDDKESGETSGGADG